MIRLDVIQGGPEWFMARAGTPSASNFDKIVTTKGEPSKQATKYLYELAGERIAGPKPETYQSAAMVRGLELEAEARAYFELVEDVEVQQTGICYTDDKRVSCSPDGLLPDAGLEIKCPLIHTHVGYLLAGVFPTDYVQQVQGSMLVTGFMAWWFFSYVPGLPPLIVKVPRDNKFCAALKVELESFCEQLDDITEKIRRLG